MSDILPSFISGAFGIAGNSLGNSAARKAAAQQAALQKEFAQNGIRWKVADAKAAGLHPLAALGAQTTSYQPVSVGQDFSAFGQMGQDVSRAMMATADAKERAGIQAEQMQMQRESHGAQINRINAETALDEMRMREIASRINKNASAQIGPPMPRISKGGKPNSPQGFVMEDNRIVKSNPSDATLAAGPAAPGFQKFRVGGAKYGFDVELPSQQMSESLEGAEWFSPVVLGSHYLSRGLESVSDFIKSKGGKPNYKLPPGYRWQRGFSGWEAVKLPSGYR